MNIMAHKTAISRNCASAPTRKMFGIGEITPISRVYDWGCGKGKDSEWLRQQGCTVISYDPYHSPENSPDTIDFSKVDIIICNYVLNVIADKSERSLLLAKMAKIASMNSIKVILSVRPEKEILKSARKGNWNIYNDGFVTSHHTFQKGYEQEEIVTLIHKSGRIRVRNTYNVSGGIICIF